MMNHFFLLIHIIFGAVALIAGALAMLAIKGNAKHRLAGKCFAWSMTITAISAILLTLFKPNPFLLSIGFFTLYLNSSGWIWVMRLPQNRKVKFHYAIATFGGFSGIYLFFLAFYIAGSSAMILMVFGGIQLLLSIQDFILPLKPDKNITRHISKTGAAYIAATTAFLVSTVGFLPPIISWLGPTIVGTVFISMAVAKQQRKKMRI